MLFLYQLNSGLPAIFDSLLIPFKEQNGHYTRGAGKNTSIQLLYKYPKNENLFLMVPDQFGLRDHQQITFIYISRYHSYGTVQYHFSQLLRT